MLLAGDFVGVQPEGAEISERRLRNFPVLPAGVLPHDGKQGLLFLLGLG